MEKIQVAETDQKVTLNGMSPLQTGSLKFTDNLFAPVKYTPNECKRSKTKLETGEEDIHTHSKRV